MDYGIPLHCQHCGTLNSLQNSMMGVPACVSCGMTSVEGAFSMQDELSKMFASSMTFRPSPPPTVQTSRPPLGYSASQHYVPITKPATPPPEPQSTAASLPLAAQQILAQNGIDPFKLAQSQQLLFLNATTEQRQRLIELWRISSQANSVSGVDRGGQTTMEKEELVARTRWHEQQQYDETAEPYIQNGYNMHGAARRELYSPLGSAVGNKQEYKQAVDPAFNGSTQWWIHGDAQEQRMREEKEREQMQMQYGMFEAMRQHQFSNSEDEMAS